MGKRSKAKKGRGGGNNNNNKRRSNKKGEIKNNRNNAASTSAAGAASNDTSLPESSEIDQPPFQRGEGVAVAGPKVTGTKAAADDSTTSAEKLSESPDVSSPSVEIDDDHEEAGKIPPVSSTVSVALNIGTAVEHAASPSKSEDSAVVPKEGGVLETATLPAPSIPNGDFVELLGAFLEDSADNGDDASSSAVSNSTGFASSAAVIAAGSENVGAAPEATRSSAASTLAHEMESLETQLKKEEEEEEAQVSTQRMVPVPTYQSELGSNLDPTPVSMSTVSCAAVDKLEAVPMRPVLSGADSCGTKQIVTHNRVVEETVDPTNSAQVDESAEGNTTPEGDALVEDAATPSLGEEEETLIESVDTPPKPLPLNQSNGPKLGGSDPHSTPAPASARDYVPTIETPSPSNVADLKNKLWDENGLPQVRIRPSVKASAQSRQLELSPVPSPFKPTTAASSFVKDDKNSGTALPSSSTSVKEKAAYLMKRPTDRSRAMPSSGASTYNISTTTAASARSSSAITRASATSFSGSTPAPASSTAATGLSANNSGKRLSRRKGPISPHSVLDRKALLNALDQRGVHYKDVHITAFYQALHRQQYPDLPTFVDNYNKHESRRELPELAGPSALSTVSHKKNRNKLQLPKAFLQFLADPNNGFVTVTSKVAEAKTSQDKSTTKLAIRLHDGQMVESVLMRYSKSAGRENHRASLCISSQCGCAMGCTFCATGMMGLSGNLSMAEIVEQIIHADRILAKEWTGKQEDAELAQVTSQSIRNEYTMDAVRNVVFMGMVRSRFGMTMSLHRQRSLTRLRLS